MAPEQFEGLPTLEADVYSFGCTCAEVCMISFAFLLFVNQLIVLCFALLITDLVGEGPVFGNRRKERICRHFWTIGCS